MGVFYTKARMVLLKSPREEFEAEGPYGTQIYQMLILFQGCGDRHYLFLAALVMISEFSKYSPKS